jgi:hypothetical protein
VGIGTCSTTERKFSKPEHDILAIAHTRAKNRAISDLIGLGEVSAEELEADQPFDSPLGKDTKSITEAERLAREKARTMGQERR